VNSDEPRDPSIDAAYRSTARDEPPGALDERILAAAHRAVEARPVPVGRSFAQRWRVPVAVAATVVLSATVTLMIYESEKTPPMPERLSPGKVREDQVAPAMPASRGDLDKGSGARKAKPPALLEERRVAPETGASRPSAPADRDALRQVPAQESSRMQSSESKMAPAPFPAEPARPATPPAASAPRAKENEAPVAKKREAPGAALSTPAAEAERASSMTRERTLADRPTGRTERDAGVGAAQSVLQSPEDWIAEIRRLKQAGKADEANRLLVQFRERFPDYPLPEDLR